MRRRTVGPALRYADNGYLGFPTHLGALATCGPAARRAFWRSSPMGSKSSMPLKAALGFAGASPYQYPAGAGQRSSKTWKLGGPSLSDWFSSPNRVK
jgi:hypothetical protein